MQPHCLRPAFSNRSLSASSPNTIFDGPEEAQPYADAAISAGVSVSRSDQKQPPLAQPQALDQSHDSVLTNRIRDGRVVACAAHPRR
jgi:hypothetical protein